MYLTVENDGSSAGANVIQYKGTGSLGQRWILEQNSNGSYRLVIFKNITFSHDSGKNANDDIQMYISNGNNFWLDHCTFKGHSSMTSSDVDKHVYVGLNSDYVSITGCNIYSEKNCFEKGSYAGRVVIRGK